MFKFRARIENGTIVEGSLITKESTFLIGCYETSPPTMQDPCGDTYWIEYQVIPESLAISTGLQDKNGVEIFSSFPVNGVMSKGGDVIKYSEYSVHNPNEYFGIIIYHNGKFVFYNSNEYIDVEFIREHCIILGNQFDKEETKC